VRGSLLISTLTPSPRAAQVARAAASVEIKSDPRTADFDPSYAVVDAVTEAIEGVATPILVTSFDRDCIDRVREVAPGVPTGRLAIRITDVGELLERTAAAGHVAINPWDPFVDEAFVALAHGHGLRVYPWTVDDPARHRELLDAGVDGIITNVPDVLREVIGR